MRNLLFSVIFSIIFLPFLFAQDIHQIKLYADDQFTCGNYQIALKEFQRVLFFDSVKQYTDIYLKIATIHYLKENFQNAIKYYNMAWNVEKNDSIKCELIFLKSLCHFKLSAWFEALNELLGLPESDSSFFRDKANLFFGICYYGLNEYKTSFGYFAQLADSSGKRKLSALYSEFDKIQRKYDPDKVEIMSLLLPGSGQIYAGKIGSGLNSFILTGSIIVYGVLTAVNYSIIDGIFVLNSWFYRYYHGGAKNAAAIARKKINKTKSENYTKILEILGKHPNNRV